MKNPPRIKFANLPTPIEPLPRLGVELGGPLLWIKRDDLTGLAFGGNKIRKLEFLLAEAQGHGADTLITAGAAQSNHCRQTAAVAARFGMDCILVLVREPGNNDEHSRPSGNLLLDVLLGAEIVWTQAERRDQMLLEVFDNAWREGKRPYLIPHGGSNAVGAVAYAFAIRELIDQVRDGMMGGRTPDWIVFPTSSGGTQAGMVLGAALYAFEGNILGISIDKPAEDIQNLVADLAIVAAEHLGEHIILSREGILVNSDYLGAGYGRLSEQEVEAIRIFARREGILLDPVYTGRAAAGMIDLIQKGFFTRGQSVLFWHTGGQPALFADRYRDLLY